jgi:endoglucanase
MKYCKQLPFILILLCMHSGMAAQSVESIRLNQVGYYPAAPKKAVVTATVATDSFYLVTDGNKAEKVFAGKLGVQTASEYSSYKTRLADFSSFQKQGRYKILVPGLGASYPFTISANAHSNVSKASLKGFYYMRSDRALEPAYAGKWARTAGHPDTEVFIHPSAASASRPAGTKLSSPGGWYDAGDYNKYIVNSGITMGTLLSAYEDFPGYFDTLNTGIPESRDAVPDILNEVAYNLRWMLTMQDPSDGGVYHKLTNAAFDGMVMPGVTKAPRYMVQKSTAAALDFAAVTAQASRVYRRFPGQFRGLADSCLTAARKAWQWAEKNPALLYSQRDFNKDLDPDITTGEYGDRRVTDEWLWAAAELFATTRHKSYYDTVKKYLSLPVSLPGWSNVGMMGYYTMIRFGKTLPPYTLLTLRAMKDSVQNMAERFTRGGNKAFHTVMGQSKSDFVWGSSSVAANQGILLINAWLQTSDPKYMEYALSNLDYLLGRNATGYSFLTGTGSRQVMHPHHRPSVADGIAEPVPGLLSGGPNPGRQDSCQYQYTEPETAFTDHDCSYASNEIAINWNAPLVYLAGALEAYFRNVSVTGNKVLR